MSVKRCIQCGTDKEFEEFYNSSGSKDGKQPRCKDCSRERLNEWREANRDRYNAMMRNLYHKNKARFKALSGGGD